MFTFQERVYDWLIRCFGPEISAKLKERCYRFFEEATELVQSLGLSREDCHALIDYVYARPVGNHREEIGGTLVCLAALCSAIEEDMDECGDAELVRIELMMDKIRKKNAEKPFRDGPMPGFSNGTCHRCGRLKDVESGCDCLP